MNYFHNLGLLFDNNLKIYSDQVAIKIKDSQTSYLELNKLVEKIVAAFISSGFQRGDVVMIANEKKLNSFALMLACLKLGLPYVNIDIASPSLRNRKIVDLCQPKFVFYDDQQSLTSMNQLLQGFEVTPILIDDFLMEKSVPGTGYNILDVDSSCVAYIMFTSGSTGNPKGVAITHQNLLHFIEWGKSCFNINTSDRFANLSPMYFDNSVFDFYLALFSGATLVPVERCLLSQPHELVQEVSRQKCTIWFSVPSLLMYLNTMKVTDSSTLNYLRHIIFGGEGYPKVELKKLYDKFSGRTLFTNVYGPTECTCICSAHHIDDEDFQDMTGFPMLGRLNQNIDSKILDENENESDIGELCLIGANVAAGYFNDLERTHQSFTVLIDPARFMKKMYKTGDLVRREQGNLFFIGRKDNQIKHMGYRIELEEIEIAISQLSNIKQVAVTYTRENSAYGKIVAHIAGDEIVEAEILKELTNFLPKYMLPNKIFVYQALPKNPNGKVDRNKLSSISL